MSGLTTIFILMTAQMVANTVVIFWNTKVIKEVVELDAKIH
jgi:hypothetical protein